jgi:hypothetical protein
VPMAAVGAEEPLRAQAAMSQKNLSVPRPQSLRADGRFEFQFLGGTSASHP